jgi:predicted RNase H-like nuclease (RuvC/YqgF family)
MDVQKLFINEQRGINLISNKKHLEEISQLNKELIKTRREYSSRVIELELKIKLLNSELAEANEKLNEKSEELKKAGNFKRQKIMDSGKINIFEKKISELEEELQEKDKFIEQLHEIASKRSGSKVGRKSKATDENVAEISRLRDEGYSYAGIAKIIIENTGEKISKSTVANIVTGKNRL